MEQRPEGKEGGESVIFGERVEVFQAKGTVLAKALRQEKSGISEQQGVPCVTTAE